MPTTPNSLRPRIVALLWITHCAILCLVLATCSNQQPTPTAGLEPNEIVTALTQSTPTPVSPTEKSATSPTSSPTPTRTITPSPHTKPISKTATVVEPQRLITRTPTGTPTRRPIRTIMPTTTNTPTPKPTITPTPTRSKSPEPTPTHNPESALTPTQTPANTPEPKSSTTPVPTTTYTPEPEQALTVTPTEQPNPTATPDQNKTVVDMSNLVEETGDDIESAVSIEIGRTLDGVFDSEDDADFFVFEASEGDFYSIAVTRPGTIRSYVDIFDSANQYIISGIYLDGDADYPWKVPASGTYYLRLRSLSLTQPPSEYSVTVGPADLDEDYGDSSDTASLILIDTPTNGHTSGPDDIDYFRFEALPSRSYGVKVTAAKDNAVIARLHSPEGQELAYAFSDDGKSARLFQKTVTGEQHYISVSGANGETTYQLEVRADDHGNDVESATSVALDTTIYAVLDGVNDYDTFQFPAESGSRYSVELGGEFDWRADLRFFDFDGMLPINVLPSTVKARSSGPIFVLVYDGVGAHRQADFESTSAFPYVLEIRKVPDATAPEADVIAQANEIAFGQFIETKISAVDDRDLFTFQGEAGDSFIIDFLLPLPYLADVQIIDSHGEAIATDTFTPNRVWMHYLLELPQSGTYYLTVVPTGDFFSSCLRYSCDGDGAYSIQIRPSEFKDFQHWARSDASPLTLGERVDDMIGCYKDIDNYKINLEKGQTYRIRTDFPSQYSAQLIIYDQHRNKIGIPPSDDRPIPEPDIYIPPDTRYYSCEPFSEAPADPSKHELLFQPQVNGEFTISIAKPDSSLFERYSLSVEIAESQEIFDDHPDFPQYGSELAMGEQIVGELHSRDDFDSFRFQAVEGNAYEIAATLGTASQIYVRFLRPYYESGSLSYIDDWWLRSNPEISDDRTGLPIVWVAPKTGEYYLIVETLYGGTTGTYTVQVNTANNDDDHGDDQDHATEISIGTTVEGSIGSTNDRDFFKVDAPVGKLIKARLTGPNTPSLHIRLSGYYGFWDARGCGSKCDEPLLAELPTRFSGYYYVEVSAEGNGSYTLAVDVQPYSDDHGNGPEVATPIEFGRTYEGEISIRNDIDYFQFSAIRGTTYQVSVITDTLDVVSQTTIRNQSNGTLADTWNYPSCNRAGSSDEAACISWQPQSSGDYYISIEAPSDRTGTYSIAVAVQD